MSEKTPPTTSIAAIYDAAVKAGLMADGASLTGPQSLGLLSDLLAKVPPGKTEIGEVRVDVPVLQTQALAYGVRQIGAKHMQYFTHTKEAALKAMEKTPNCEVVALGEVSQ